MTYRLLVVGGGGQGRIVIDLALQAGHDVVGILDDQLPPGLRLLGVPVLGSTSSAACSQHTRAVVAIGDNGLREQISLRLSRSGVRLSDCLIHPAAVVSSGATLGRNSVIAAAAVVNVGALIEDGAIINTGSIVEHDCRVGAYAHICPGSCLGGNASVGERVIVGSGAIVLPGVSIGTDAVVGAGAVVTRDVPPQVTVVGVPARYHGSGGEANEVAGIAGGTANY